jgi:predicted nucleic acid-binding protein
MIVVSNTSPLTNLAAIGQFDLLRRLYSGLHIPDGVWDELNARGQRWPGRDEVATADWIERHTVQNQALVTALRRDLDRGEAESIIIDEDTFATGFIVPEDKWRERANDG